MDTRIQADIAEEADPYRVDIKALSGQEATADADDDDDIINDENTSVSHLAKLQKMALQEEEKLHEQIA